MFRLIISGLQVSSLWISYPPIIRNPACDDVISPTNQPDKSIYRTHKHQRYRRDIPPAPIAASDHSRGDLHNIANPLACLTTLSHKDTCVFLVSGAIKYTARSVLGRSFLMEITDLSGLNPFSSGSFYLLPGLGGLIASLKTGILFHYQYKVIAYSLGFSPFQTAAFTKA